MPQDYLEANPDIIYIFFSNVNISEFISKKANVKEITTWKIDSPLTSSNIYFYPVFQLPLLTHQYCHSNSKSIVCNLYDPNKVALVLQLVDESLKSLSITPLSHSLSFS